MQMKLKTKILVIFTGGTIGSTVKDGFIGPDNNRKYKLLENYSNSSYLTFDTVEPYTILSENLDGEHITQLANTISSNQYKYDGIIVTHGTDTLQYTASALSLMLPSIELPVVIVSSNYILDNPRANGYKNFHGAVTFITNTKSSGVFISYNNGGEKTYIHNGLLAMPHSPYDDKIYSLNNNFVGYIENCMYLENKEYNSGAMEMFISEAASTKLSKKSPVLFMKAYPGQIYPIPSDHIKSVLIETYHSGTLCTDDKELHQFMELCRDQKISVYLTGVEERIAYESTKLYEELGAKILPKASPIATYMLLWLTYC